MQDDKTAKVLVAAMERKNLALGVFLTLFFGGFGVFYASILGGIIMGIVEFILWIITIITFGFGLILLIPAHIIAVVWSIVAINSHNKKIMKNVLD